MVYAAIDMMAFLMHMALIAWNVRSYRKNMECFLRYRERVFLRLRRYNVALIVWSTFCMAACLIFALHALRIIK